MDLLFAQWWMNWNGGFKVRGSADWRSNHMNHTRAAIGAKPTWVEGRFWPKADIAAV